MSMPIGALEKVAEVNPRIFDLWRGFVVHQSWQLGELEAVINAGLEFGGSKLRFGKVYERHGLEFCVVLAGQLLEVAFAHDEPEKDAAPAGEPPADQMSS
jgi:hypothetical protein